MADSILNIVIRARDETQAAFVQLQQQLKSIDNSLKEINKSDIGGGVKEGFEGVGKSAQETQGHIQRLSQQVKDSALDFDFLRSAANKVVGIFAGFFTVSFIKSLADGAARTEVLGTVLEQVAANAGITADYIKDVDEKVQKLGITAESSRQSLSQFIQSGLDITKAAELARAAQDLAVISGRDSSETFSRLVTSVQQMNTVSLRWMGIIVDVEQAVQKYASAHDISAASVSRSTKQQIVLNEVLEQARKLDGLYEKSMFDVGKQLQSLDRYQKEAADSAGEVLLPAYLVLVEEFTLFLKQLKLLTDSWNATGSAAGTFAEAIKPIVSALREMVLYAIENAQALLQLAATMYVAARAGAITTTVFTVMAGAMSYTLRAIQLLGVAWRGLMALFASSPLGALLLTVGLLISGLTALWDLLAKKPKTEENDLKAGYMAQIELEEKLKNAKQELRKATEGHSKLSVKEALDIVNALKEQIDTQEKANKAAAKTVQGGNTAAKYAKEEAEDMAKLKKESNEAQKAIDETNAALTKMGISAQSARKGLNVSVGFEEQMSNFRNFVEQYRKEMNKNEDAQLVTIGQLDLMAKKIADGAKTSDEMRIALAELGSEGALTRGKLEPLLRSLELREAKAGIEEAQKAMAKFTENSQAATNTIQVLSSVEKTSQDAATDLARELLKIGVGINEQGSGLDALTGKLRTTAETQKALASVEVEALKETSKAIERRYTNELEQIAATRSARINAANALSGNVKGAQAAVLDAEKKASAESIAVAKTKYDGLAQLQAKFLQLAISTANEIKKIDEALFDSKKTLEEKLFDLKLKGKSEQEQQDLITKRIQETAAAAEAARLQGNFDLAKKLNDERIALVGKLSTGTDDQILQVQKKTKEAYAQQQSILLDQKVTKEAALEEEVQGYNEVTKKLEEIATALTQFANEQVVKLTIELDSGSLNGIVRQIQDALSNITITLKTQTQGYATGGLVRGPGTGKSDSILAALSNQEFVMNSDAVSRYGVRFMEAINSMSLPHIPRFAAGGLVGGGVGPMGPAGSDGASAGGGRDVVDVNFNLGGKKISLMGERMQVRKLVSSLKNLQGA